MAKYNIGVTNELLYDNAFDVVYDNQDNPQAGQPVMLSDDFSEFVIKKDFATTIFKTEEIKQDVFSFKQLITFYGAVPKQELEAAYRDALAGNLDNPPKGGLEGKTYEQPSDPGGLFGSAGGSLILKIPGVPAIAWIGLGILSAIQYGRTRNPIYAGGAVYSYLLYNKNK